jgi:hypothetical protein
MNVFEHVDPSIDKVPINPIWVDKWFHMGCKKQLQSPITFIQLKISF